MPSICQTIYEYTAAVLTTTTTTCADPAKFSFVVLAGVGLFFGSVVVGFKMFYNK